jgi:hypothetical protein
VAVRLALFDAKTSDLDYYFAVAAAGRLTLA